MAQSETPDAPPPAELLALQPWLGHKPWRQRKIVCGRPVSGVFLVVMCIVFGALALPFIWAALAPLDPETYPVERLVVVGVIAALLTYVIVLTHGRIRARRYGDSVCRLITLPGVVGGWLKADVECDLPAGGDDKVTVRLMNADPMLGKGGTVVWRMERQISVAVSPGMRSTVPVRLRIPRSIAQRPLKVSDGVQKPVSPNDKVTWEMFLYPAPAALWTLEIEKRVPGIDFLAIFRVPVYDIRDAPAAEQVDEPAADARP